MSRTPRLVLVVWIPAFRRSVAGGAGRQKAGLRTATALRAARQGALCPQSNSRVIHSSYRLHRCPQIPLARPLAATQWADGSHGWQGVPTDGRAYPRMQRHTSAGYHRLALWVFMLPLYNEHTRPLEMPRACPVEPHAGAAGHLTIHWASPVAFAASLGLSVSAPRMQAAAKKSFPRNLCSRPMKNAENSQHLQR